MKNATRGIAYSIYALISIMLLAIMLASLLRIISLTGKQYNIYTSETGGFILEARNDIMTSIVYNIVRSLYFFVIEKTADQIGQGVSVVGDNPKFVLSDEEVQNYLEPFYKLYSVLSTNKKIAVNLVFTQPLRITKKFVIKHSNSNGENIESINITLYGSRLESAVNFTPSKALTIEANITTKMEIVKLGYLIDPFTLSVKLQAEYNAATYVRLNSSRVSASKLVNDKLVQCEIKAMHVERESGENTESESTSKVVVNVDDKYVFIYVPLTDFLADMKKLEALILCEGMSKAIYPLLLIVERG